MLIIKNNLFMLLIKVIYKKFISRDNDSNKV